MVEQEIKTKKKRKMLMLRLQNPDEKSTPRDLSQLSRRLNDIFRYHIGKAEAISSVDLFMEVFMVDPVMLPLYERNYLWSILKAALARMRTDEVLFTVCQGSSWYVISTQDEADHYKNRCDIMIQTWKDMKVKADRWVANKKWRRL